MSEIDVVKLRRLAENATPSPWEHQPYRGSGPSGEMLGGDVFGGDGEYLVSEISDDNGAFIAAVEPATVLALLDRLEQAEAAIERVRALHRNGGSSQGRTDEGYGYLKNCCETCGEFGEYGVEWPCFTVSALDKKVEK